MQYTLSKTQAARFMLYRHGLIGNNRYEGKEGILSFIDQVSCIQYDPVDVCGKNADLVLQSRITGYQKSMLYDLLYKDRMLFDFYDKNLCIMNISDWKYFERRREHSRQTGRSFEKVNEVCDQVKDIIRKIGPVSTKDVGFRDKVHWYWSDMPLATASLESMYLRGDLAIHHKKGTIKYYDLAENCIPKDLLSQPEPNPLDEDYNRWRLLRRIGAVGLLWNKASDAWLNLPGSIKARERNEIFGRLIAEETITAVKVEGMNDFLYCRSSDRDMIEMILKDPPLKSRCEFIAPLDNMLWDRKLIKEIFGFSYKWEIYTVEAQRKYGYYTLPVLYGDRFIGRIDMLNDRKNKCLVVKKIWFEDGVKQTVKMMKDIEKCMDRFAVFNDCVSIDKRYKGI
ncbi:MAG: crosslink repair DNA glycosylase YcaQ family protein [Clostridia bacterium]